MALNLATIKALIAKIDKKSPLDVFSILSRELDIVFNPLQIDDLTLRQCYRRITQKIHPDKVEAEEKTQELASQLFRQVHSAFNQQLSNLGDLGDLGDLGNQQHSIDDRVINLDVLLQNREISIPVNANIARDLLAALIFPAKLPTLRDNTTCLAQIPDKIWRSGRKSLDELINKINQLERQEQLRATSERNVFRQLQTIEQAFSQSEQLWKEQKNYLHNPTMEEFIELTVLPGIRDRLNSAVGLLDAFNEEWPHHKLDTRGEHFDSYAEIERSLLQTFALGWYKDSLNIDPFLKKKTNKQRQDDYLMMKQQLRGRIVDYIFLNELDRGLARSIIKYEDHYSGFLGSLRTFFRKTFDTASWNADQKALATLKVTLQGVRSQLIDATPFQTLMMPYTLPTYTLPMAKNTPTGSLMSAFLDRLHAIKAVHTPDSHSSLEKTKAIYSQVKNQSLNYQPISKEMGGFGFFGLSSQGHTKTQQRCLHTLKQIMLNDLKVAAAKVEDRTISISPDILRVFNEHNSRFWHFGKTKTQQQFERNFKLLEKENESNEVKSYQFVMTRV